uniref:5-formyltetrahydrofolate cyclo-ligase n=1 Tax=Panagrolaimus sp. ES5 TaxID=591445 RepID=A0AC34FHU4_9BILA
MSELKAAKKLLRTKIGAIVSALSDAELQNQTNKIESKIFGADWFEQSQRISVFVSTKGEIITDNIIKKALEMKKDVFIPRFKKGATDMEMLKLESLEEFTNLQPTLWGIRQQSLDSEAESFHLSGPLDLVLTPSVAFTPEGKRLGHGKGFYDRFFASHQKLFNKMPLKVGLGLKEQIIDDLPVSEYDVLMDVVISP